MTEGTTGDGRWQVGELSRRTGVTVRALHHYDQIGLLAPEERSDSGYRLYGPAEVVRLAQIVLLRRLGLSLAQVALVLGGTKQDLGKVLRQRLADLDRSLARDATLRAQTAAIIHQLQADDRSPETLLEEIEELMAMESGVRQRISILVYEDIEAAHDYLVRVFGLGAGRLERDGAGNVVHGEVDAGDGVIWLHRHAPEHGLVSPRAVGASTAMTVVMVDDVDQHYARVVAAGGTPTGEPYDADYGFREFTATGPEGELWSFMKPLD